MFSKALILCATVSSFAPKRVSLVPAPSLRRRTMTVVNMNMFDRFKRVAEANLNNVLGKRVLGVLVRSTWDSSSEFVSWSKGTTPRVCASRVTLARVSASS